MLQYKDQISGLIDFLQFEVNYCDITKANISQLLDELRDILKGMRDLHNNPGRDMLVIPYEGVRNIILEARLKLFLALYILNKGSSSLTSRVSLYQSFIDCSLLLSNMVEMYFALDDFSESL